MRKTKLHQSTHKLQQRDSAPFSSTLFTSSGSSVSEISKCLETLIVWEETMMIIARLRPYFGSTSCSLLWFRKSSCLIRWLRSSEAHTAILLKEQFLRQSKQERKCTPTLCIRSSECGSASTWTTDTSMWFGLRTTRMALLSGRVPLVDSRARFRKCSQQSSSRTTDSSKAMKTSWATTELFRRISTRSTQRLTQTCLG